MGLVPANAGEMREVRERHGPIPLEIDLAGEHVIKTDVGLIDVIVFFEAAAEEAGDVAAVENGGG